MRKVTKAMRKAFIGREAFKSENTEVRIVGDEVAVFLWKNKIAWTVNGNLWISTCGWSTATTVERLNGLPGVHVSRAGGLTLHGLPWDGKPICVNTREQLKEQEDNSLGFIAGVAMLGDIFTNTQQESNDWKKRMLKAGLGNMLHMPEDWDQLPEDEKQRRLDGAIETLK